MAFDAAQQSDDVVMVDGQVLPMDQGVERDIPLNRLFLSAKNVRQLRNPETIPALAATIKAQGLLNRLCVIPEQAKGSRVKGETFGVVAGGRRYAALLYLLEQGQIAEDEPIKCKEFSPEQGTAVSLTENTQQESMHPADQLEAFKKLVDEGKSAGEVAAAFGVSTTTVEKRLALARLAPMFIDLFRAGNIKQEQLQALALTTDHAQQIAAWESLPSYDRSAYRIKKAITTQEVPAYSNLVRFVGLDAYRAAGGTVREDMFADEGNGLYLQDATLLASLVNARLESCAEQLRAEGWKWVEARHEFTAQDRARFFRLTCEQATPTKVEKTAMDDMRDCMHRIASRIDELEQLTEWDEDTDDHGRLTDEQQAELDSLEDQHEQLGSYLDAMTDALRVWTPEQKTIAGAVAAVGENGEMVISLGLVRSEDRKAAAAAGDSAAAMTNIEGGPKVRAEYSAALCQNMTAHRTAAVAASLSANPGVALAALLHTLIGRDRHAYVQSPLGVRFDSNAHNVERNAAEFDSTKASEVLARADRLLDALPTDAGALFAHLLAMSLADQCELLARYVGRAYSVQSPDPLRNWPFGFDLAQGIEAALQVDMADWWHPSIENFLGHVPKGKMMEAVTQCLGEKEAQPIASLKKADAIAMTASLLDGRRWLPSTLRPYAPSLPDQAEDDDEEGMQA